MTRIGLPTTWCGCAGASRRRRSCWTRYETGSHRSEPTPAVGGDPLTEIQMATFLPDRLAGDADDDNGCVGDVSKASGPTVRRSVVNPLGNISHRLEGDRDGKGFAHRASSPPAGDRPCGEQWPQLPHRLWRTRALVASDIDGVDRRQRPRRPREPGRSDPRGAARQGTGDELHLRLG